MKLKYFLTFVMIFFAMGFSFAQDDLLSQLEADQPKEKQITPYAFKGLQICNMQSTKLPVKGDWYILISHRFGNLANGTDNFFGLDQAYTKLGAIYGVTNWLSLGATRHTFGKIYELAAKYKMANQEDNGFPVTIVGYNTMDINTELENDGNIVGLKFNHRLAYTTQLLVSRKISERLTVETAPIYVHKNLYDAIDDQKDLFLLGTGARYKLSKRLSLNLEYAARLNLPEDTNSKYHNPLSIGLDIETGGHVFQLVFSNGQTMNDVSMFSNTKGRWDGKQELYFGFNMYRVF
jgi:hypothetical protein